MSKLEAAQDINYSRRAQHYSMRASETAGNRRRDVGARTVPSLRQSPISLVVALFVSLAVLQTSIASAQTASAAPCQGTAFQSHAWCNPVLQPETRAKLLLKELNLDEKMELMEGDLKAAGDAHVGATAAIPRLGLRNAWFTDGPNGVAPRASTGLPVPIAVAATFNPEMAALHARVVGSEARDRGNDFLFGPTANIMRTPLGGRTFESFGEDPYLMTKMTVSWFRSLQTQGILAVVKHFAANNQESALAPDGHLSAGGRTWVNEVVDERTLHEIYLPHFEAAIREAGVRAVMCAYNRVNGDYACENPTLLKRILRSEFGFNGMVVADYGATHDVAAAVTNGLDFEPLPEVYKPDTLRKALAAGRISESEIDRHVLHILTPLIYAGLLDSPPHADSESDVDKEANARLAEKVELQAITILKNDGILPISRAVRRMAIVGPDAALYKSGGKTCSGCQENGSGGNGGKPFFFTTPLDGIRTRAGAAIQVDYADGSDPDLAKSIARAADLAIVFASDAQQEGYDAPCLGLNCTNSYRGDRFSHLDQEKMIDDIAKANPNTIVVLETGGPVLTPWRDRVKGILEAWYPGSGGGKAIASVLFGDSDPGGRLPVTFPLSKADEPTADSPRKYPGIKANAYYDEGLLVGYRWFDEHHLAVAFPFGWGISYTSVRFGALSVTPTGDSKTIKVTAEVKNTGARSGYAVGELYLAFPNETSGEPPRQLKGFKKVDLRPGESEEMEFDLTARDLSWWDSKAHQWCVAAGCFTLWLGTSSRDLVESRSFDNDGNECNAHISRAAGGMLQSK